MYLPLYSQKRQNRDRELGLKLGFFNRLLKRLIIKSANVLFLVVFYYIYLKGYLRPILFLQFVIYI